MSEYVCIAMLEDPPFNVILATAKDPIEWLNKLPLPSHMILCELLPDARKVKQMLIKTLKEADISALSDKAFSAQIHVVLDVYLRVREHAMSGKKADQISEDEIPNTVWTRSKILHNNKQKSEAEGYFELAEKYYNGNGLELDREKAKTLYFKAAENEHAESQYIIASRYFNESFSGDYKDYFENGRQSEKWYRLAAEQGHIKALAYLVESVAESKKEAKNWYKKICKAAEEGNADAQYQMGTYCLGYTACASDFNINEDENLSKSWYLKASKEYQQLAEQGDPIAQTRLGEMYLDFSFDHDPDKALFWLKKAADQNQMEALSWIGYLYDDEFKDRTEAVYWYLKAAEMGDSFSAFRLFEIYRLGDGVDYDEKQAAIWCIKAAERAHLEAQIYLIDIYITGKGLEKNEKLVDIWFDRFQKDSQNDNKLFIFGLKPILFERRVPLCFETILKFVRNFVRGTNRDFQDENEKEFYCFKMIAEYGYVSAQSRLAQMYLEGIGIEKDDYQAFIWFTKAAEQGDAYAQYNLAVMFFKGRGVKQDKELAISWCQKAAVQGHQAAKEALLKIGVDCA